MNGCWTWHGRVSTSGYGRIGQRYAHRVSYELFIGPIPDGLHVDHLCRNRLCVNPEHLEAVTQAENNRRAGPFTRASHLSCRAGHPYIDGSWYRRKADGHRVCRECERERSRRYRTRLREQAS